MSWNIPRLFRRQLLKASAGTTSLSLLSPLNSLQSQASSDEHAEIETSHSLCNFGSSLCNLPVKTENRGGRKRVVKLAGNPHSTFNRGWIQATEYRHKAYAVAGDQAAGRSALSAAPLFDLQGCPRPSLVRNRS